MDRKLCIDVFSGFQYDELLPMVAEAGFDGFFSGEMSAKHNDQIAECRKLANKLGLYYETSHSTIPGSTSIWQNGELGDRYAETLFSCIDNCALHDVPILVVHIATDDNKPNFQDIGLKRLEQVVEHALQKNIKIAFENINNAKYLFDTLNHFLGDNVGFCYDCGHESCHTPEVKYLPLLSNRLICTHIHDNHGKDDEHLIPFDGCIDFKNICTELSKCTQRVNITLELTYTVYQSRYSKEEFLAKSFSAAKKLLDYIIAVKN